MRVLILFLISCITLHAHALDLDDLAQDYVLESKKITLKEYPGATNPSLVRWKGSILMSFRIFANPWNTWHSCIGLIWLDEKFNPKGPAYFLDTRFHKPYAPFRSEDARLLTVGDHLYIIYNDNEEIDDNYPRRMFVSELFFKDGQFSLTRPEGLAQFEGVDHKRWEKNWIPFDYKGELLLAYKINPHLIFRPKFGTMSCSTECTSEAEIHWAWGLPRLFGGTPALLMDGNYLSFFHSSLEIATAQSGNCVTYHYFIGAYTFIPEPPFTITHFSPLPILWKGMYSNPIIHKRVVFPGGYVFDEKYIWLAYGREDCEMWIVKMDRKKVLQSLIRISPKKN